MKAPITLFALGLALGVAGCGGSSSPMAPNPEPPVNDPATPAPDQGVQGAYLLEQINGSKPGQLVTLANPDGKVIALYRFEATRLDMETLQTFAMQLRYTDDKEQYGIDDQGGFEQAGPVSQQGALPLTFSSEVYGDKFTGVVTGDFVAIRYDFDGDGQPDTSFGFRRQAITLP
jgi:hypothetical protein